MKCKNCDKEFFEKYSEWSNGDYCSKYCSHSYTGKQNKGTKIVKCIQCSIEIEVDKRASDKLCKCDNCRKSKKYNQKNKIKKKKSKTSKKKRNYFTKKCRCGKYLYFNNKTGQCIDCYNENLYNDYIQKWLSDGINIVGSPRSSIRKYILKRQNNVCDICGLNQIWNNKTITFILDHINGDSNNHNEKNLRMICPNCDSQLETYKSKNKFSSRKYDREYRKSYYQKNNILSGRLAS